MRWRRDSLPTPVFLGFPRGLAGREAACNVGDLDSIPGLEDPLKKGEATHSGIVAFRVPWTLQSTGLQRVRHDRATLTSLLLRYYKSVLVF